MIMFYARVSYNPRNFLSSSDLVSPQVPQVQKFGRYSSVSSRASKFHGSTPSFYSLF